MITIYNKVSMMNSLNEELSNIIGLINYDRSKTIFEQSEQIVTNYDKNWDYKRDGNTFFAKRKTSDKWIKLSGNSETAVKTKVFGLNNKEETKTINKNVSQSQKKTLRPDLERIDFTDSTRLSSDKTGNDVNYNSVSKTIQKSGSFEEYLNDQKSSAEYVKATKYDGDKAPEKPTVYSPKEGQYYDSEGNLKSPNAYWVLPYKSRRFDYLNRINKLDKPSSDNEYKKSLMLIYNEDMKDWEKREQPWERDLKTMTLHDWLETAEIVTGTVGMLPFPPVALAGNLLSMGFGVANSALYAYEGKHYDASIAMAFALLPGPEVARLSKTLKTTGKTTVKGAETITDDAIKMIDDGVKKGWKQFLMKNLNYMYKQKGINYTMKYLQVLYNKMPGLAKFYINIAGVPLTFEQLYFLWVKFLTEEEKLKQHENYENSDLKAIMDVFKRPDTFIVPLFKKFVNWLSGKSDEELPIVGEKEVVEVKPSLDKQGQDDLMNRLHKKQKQQ